MPRTGKKHHRYVDYSGQTFGMLTALDMLPKDPNAHHPKWLLMCECGQTTAKVIHDVKKSLRKGATPNCGCSTGRLLGDKMRTHGMTKHPAYAIWRSMNDRCRLPSHQAWRNYGARGIAVCPEWRDSFETFWLDMGPTYAAGLELDRRDNSQGYSAINCRWVPRQTNANNRRTNLWIETSAGRETVADACRRVGISRHLVYYRLQHGWSGDDLLLPAGAERQKFSTSPTAARSDGL